MQNFKKEGGDDDNGCVTVNYTDNYSQSLQSLPALPLVWQLACPLNSWGYVTGELLSLQEAQPSWTGLGEESDERHFGTPGWGLARINANKELKEAYTRNQRCGSRNNAFQVTGPMTGVGQRKRSELAAGMYAPCIRPAGWLKS